MGAAVLQKIGFVFFFFYKNRWRVGFGLWAVISQPQSIGSASLIKISAGFLGNRVECVK